MLIWKVMQQPAILNPIFLWGEYTFKYLLELSGQRHRTIWKWNIYRDFTGTLDSIYLTMDLNSEKFHFFTYKNVSNSFLTIAK